MRGGKFLPAFFVDEVTLGETFSAGEWPLHITLFPPVDAPYEQEYGRHIRSFLNPLDPFYAKVGESALFGPNQDVFVRKIEANASLQTVHEGLVRALAYLTHDPTYRQPYNPHITTKEHDPKVQQGDAIWIEGLSIAAKAPDSTTWQVVDKIRLKGTKE